MTTPIVDDLRSLACDLRHLLGRIAIRETLCVASRLKPARLSVPLAAVDECLELLGRHGLSVMTGRSSHWIAADDGKGGWSSLPGVAGEGEPWRHVYVAWSRDDADSLREAEERGDDEDFGRRLLIPACCREMFLRRFADAPQGDLFGSTFSQPTSRCPWRVNLGAQYFDASLLSHYPCGVDCRTSATIAGLAWRIVDAAAPATASAMRSLMRSICVFSQREGIHLLPDARVDGDWILPGSLIHSTDANGRLLAFLRRSNRLACREPGVIIGKAAGTHSSLRVDGLRVVIPDEGEPRP